MAAAADGSDQRSPIPPRLLTPFVADKASELRFEPDNGRPAGGIALVSHFQRLLLAHVQKPHVARLRDSSVVAVVVGESVGGSFWAVPWNLAGFRAGQAITLVGVMSAYRSSLHHVVKQLFFTTPPSTPPDIDLHAVFSFGISIVHVVHLVNDALNLEMVGWRFAGLGVDERVEFDQIARSRQPFQDYRIERRPIALSKADDSIVW